MSKIDYYKKLKEYIEKKEKGNYEKTFLNDFSEMFKFKCLDNASSYEVMEGFLSDYLHFYKEGFISETELVILQDTLIKIAQTHGDDAHVKQDIYEFEKDNWALAFDYLPIRHGLYIQKGVYDLYSSDAKSIFKNLKNYSCVDVPDKYSPKHSRIDIYGKDKRFIHHFSLVDDILLEKQVKSFYQKIKER